MKVTLICIKLDIKVVKILLDNILWQSILYLEQSIKNYKKLRKLRFNYKTVIVK